MAQEAEQELARLVTPETAFITYRPLRTEADYAHVLPIPSGARVYEVAPRASLDPVKEAFNAMALVRTTRAIVLIPGRRFDLSGTRHGQGGGWYDRFLARVPSEWIRVGVCTSDQLSLEPLLRNSWDQPMDILCVLDEDGQHEIVLTGARPGTL